ncbi:hypothetical protein WICPIJ_008264 [Wickerhamomyces pijperi]|uniref:Uncharacterized protein n=1 Tax=Wickerhamomyces pijperi TaxID=599730 RepID=A0A9P8TIW9_WICPI|nr:hypothetical protein WICPIJ_008264 [Wickerhamomyces pijperi]
MEFSKGIKIDFDCIFTAFSKDFIESEEPSLRFEALQNRDIVLRGKINMAMNYYQTHQSLPPRRHTVKITGEDALIFRKTARLFAASFDMIFKDETFEVLHADEPELCFLTDWFHNDNKATMCFHILC